jgi:hypothetical protein
MRKILTTLFLIAFMCPLAIFAANTGNLKGKVFLDNKEPAMGATIKVKGSNQGTKAKSDGSFLIVGVPAGNHDITVSYVSYADKTIQVTISADATTEMGSISLTTNMKQTEEIVVLGTRLTDAKKNGSQVNISGEAMQLQAKEGIAAMVGSTAGVNNSGDGWNIRGGRSNETAIRMDGVNISNPLNGGFGFGGTSLYPMPSVYATSETQVKKGAFSAEYGDAMAGYVNSSLMTGNNEKYDGFLRWRTDVPALWGRQGSKLNVVQKDGVLKAENGGEGYKLLGSNENSIDFGVGGPIPFTDKRATFYLSTVYKNTEYGGNSYDIKDPLGNSIGQMDNTSNWVKNITARVKYDITNDLSLTLGGSYGLTSSENNSWSWLYATDPGVLSTTSYEGSIASAWTGVSENIAKQNVNNIQVVNLLAKIRKTFNESSILNFSISYNINNEYSGRRANAKDPDFFSGFDLLYPADNYQLVSDEVSGSRLSSGKDQVADYYLGFRKKKNTSDGFYEGSFLDVNPLTGYIEGDYYYSTHNAYGLYGPYFNSHDNSGFEFRNIYYWQINGDYEIVFDQNEFNHSVKTGFEVTFYELNRHYNPNPTLEQAYADIYTDKWGGNIYSTDPAIKANSSKPFKPTQFAYFLLDQIVYKHIIINPGLRFDYFDANSRHRTNVRTGNNITFADIAQLSDDALFTDTDAKLQVSPRISISYPINETSDLQIAYGVYLQRASLQEVYDGFNSWGIAQGAILGNPDMKSQRTNEYQIEYETSFGDMFAFVASAYYRDIYNQVGVTFTKALPSPYYTYTTTEYGSTKGFELTLTKRPLGDHIGFEVNYAYSTSIGTSPSATSNVGRAPIPNTEINTIELTEYLMGYDIPHKINANINLGWGNNEGPAIGGIELLENANINMSTVWQSGTPYTALKLSGEAITEANLARNPSFWRVDLRISESFNLKDFFGDGAGDTKIMFFCDVVNLFDRTAPVAYYARTNDPDDDGTNFYKKVTEFSPVTYYDKADFTNASSFNPNQYDEYGQRLYSVYSDLDKNGMGTQEEQFKQFQKYLTDVRSFRSNYQEPRTVYFGVKFDF